MLSADESIEIINERFGVHPRHRALHAKGNWCSGTFTATSAARGLSAAQHLAGEPVPVLARLSNGGGDPTVPDYAPDVRGLAVSFELPDGSRTDLSAQTAPRFFSPTSDDFLAFLRANTGRSAAVKVPLYLATHHRALRSLPVNLPAVRPVASYATARYFTIHAYRWVAADGSARYTRCNWIPEAGQHHLGPREARRRGPDYLREELHERLAAGPVRFTPRSADRRAGRRPRRSVAGVAGRSRARDRRHTRARRDRSGSRGGRRHLRLRPDARHRGHRAERRSGAAVPRQVLLGVGRASLALSRGPAGGPGLVASRAHVLRRRRRPDPPRRQDRRDHRLRLAGPRPRA